MSITTTQLVELYLAYFGRPPDAGGIRYYTTGNFTLNDVVRSFSASPESKALHGEGFGAAQINAIYQNLFNRDAEPAGQAYWLAAVNSGSITPAQAALSILQGAQNSDKTAVQNKLALASAFLVELDTEREITGYAGDGPAALARTFLKTVDASATSLAAALAALQTQVSLVTGQTSAPGPTPSPAPPPAFAVAKDGGNIVSFTAAGTQIAVTEAGGTFTFTSSGGSTGTGTATGTVSGAVVPTGTTLSISSTLASGKTFSGTGTALVVAGAAGEDLTAFTATGVGGFQLTTGQNYTMTAAQAAIGRIGAAGAAGTLTDPGTVTVRDTLAALGGGVAATLKTNGADSVIATAATGADVSAITVAGIDGITLATGQNYTMTAAQAALVNTAPGSQTVTLSNQATGTLNVLVESFVLGNFANSVTLGTAAQNVSSAAGNPTTLAIGGTTATGTWALANGADVLVATAGANITAVNAGAATTAESLTLTGGITMTQAQHEALVAITAGGGGDSVVITTSGVVSARNSVETYAVAQGANPNTVAVSAGTAGVNIIGGAGGTATVVIDAGVTATGTYTLAGADDRLSVSGTTSITGINGGAATTAEQLTLVTTGTTAMTQAQHAGFTTINAAGVADVISITTGGAVAAAAAVETYSVSAGGANNVTVNAGKTNVAITGASGNVTTVTVSGIAVNGAWNLGNGADLIIATGGANIAGVNSGAATTAENLALTGSIIMTQAQHEAPLAITAGGGSDSVTITTGGAVTARADVESYTVSNGGSNTLFLNARSITINGGSSGTTVSIGGNTVGGTWALGHATLDGITATDGANIAAVNAGAVTTAEKLDLTGAITMTAAQYNALNTGGITATGGSDRIILTTALTGGETLNSVVENFTLAAANYTVTLGAAQTIDAQALIAGQTLTLAGSSNAVVSLGAGNVVMTGSGNTTVTGGTGNNTITLGSGADTVNAGDGADIITGGTGIDTLNGQNGNDTFLYGSMALFISANSLLDLVDGGNNLDTVEIAGAITLTTASDLTRMSNVEQITARSQSSTALAHSIVVNSDFLLNGVTTIDLSADTNATSSATLDFTGVTTVLTLKGVGGNGNNNITGGSGVDTLVGGNGGDFFYYASAASFISGTAVVDSIDGGGGVDSISVAGALTVTGAQSLARITNVENLRVETNFGSARAYALTVQSDANLGSISKIDLVYDQATGSTATVNLTGVNRAMTVTGVFQGANVITGGSGADTLSGGRVNDTFRGGGGNDSITTSIAGAATYVFEGTGSANGTDALSGLRSTGVFDFRNFLGATSLSNTAADSSNAAAALDLSAGNNIGVRYGSSSLSTGNILTAADNGVAGEVVLSDNGKAVVFSFGGVSTSSSANGSIYYVEDTDTGAGQVWSVTLVGTLSGSNVNVSQMLSAVTYL